MEMMPQQHNNWPFIINVGNSIIGVTILAMPFCFQQCGVVLGSLMLCFSTWLTIKSCQLLVKAGVTSRRRSFSHLAYFTHGATGKLLVELCMIGLQLGTLVAQVVIIGDLGPAIVSKATGFENTSNLRTSLIVGLCLFVGLPLGLLKDLRTLSKASTMCIMFYTFFTFYVVLQSIPNLLHGDWYTKIRFWRMEGFFQCLPIFSFAFGCQTQLFIVYNAMAEPSIKRVNGIISSAVLLCFAAYLLVAFFGYIAFSNEKELTGDIINHFSENTVSDAIKLCFVISIAVSIPLIVFPCRTSLYTLLFPQKPKEDVPGSAKIPEQHFQIITASIIVGAMVTGILVPNVEFVLGLTGATMGTLICYIFPALFFIHVMSEVSEGRFSSKIVLISGLTILIASTYITLNPPEKVPDIIPLEQDLKDAQANIDMNLDKKEEMKKDIKAGMENEKVDLQEKNKPPDTLDDKLEDKRHEPPIPQEPIDTPDEGKDGGKENMNKKDEIEKKDVRKMKDQPDDGNKLQDKKADGEADKDKIMKKDSNDKVEKVKDEMKKEDEIRKDKEETEKKVKEEQEEKERKEEDNRKRIEAEKKQEEILNKLEQQQEEQQKLIEEQKEILEELKQHKDEHKEAPQDQNAQVLVQPQGQMQNQGQAAQQQINAGQVQGQIPLQQGQGQILLQQGQGQIPIQQGQGVQMQQGVGQIPLQGQGQVQMQQDKGVQLQQGVGQIPLQGQGQIPMQGQGVQMQQGVGQIPLQQGQGQMNVVPQNQVFNQPVQQQMPNQVLVQNNQGIMQQGGLNQQMVNQNMDAQAVQNMVQNNPQFAGQNLGNNFPQGQNTLNQALNAQNQGQVEGQNLEQNQDNKKQFGQQGDESKVEETKKDGKNQGMEKGEGKQDKARNLNSKNDLNKKEKLPEDHVKVKNNMQGDDKIAPNNDLDKMKHRGKRDVDDGIENNLKMEKDEGTNLESVKNTGDSNDKNLNEAENKKEVPKKVLIEKDSKKDHHNKHIKDNVEKDKNNDKNHKQIGLDSVDEFGQTDEKVKDLRDAENNDHPVKDAIDKASDKNGQRDLKMLSNERTDLANDKNQAESKDYVDEVIDNMKNKLLYENSKRVQGLDIVENSKLRR